MPRDRDVGIVVVAVTIVALAFGWVIGNEEDEEGGWVGLVVASAIAVLIAALIFGRVVPRARAAPPGRNRPARTGLVMSVVGLLTVAAFWTGLPYLLGAGGGVLGRIGELRSAEEGGRGLAVAAMVIGALAIALGTIAFATDEAR